MPSEKMTAILSRPQSVKGQQNQGGFPQSASFGIHKTMHVLSGLENKRG